MLAEVGGLGFVGLFLSTVVTGGPLGQIVGRLSEEFLGEEELLLETFEFLHTFFFEVGILFFGIAGVVVGAVLQRVQKLSEISELALDADGDGEVTLEELAEALDTAWGESAEETVFILYATATRKRWELESALEEIKGLMKSLGLKPEDLDWDNT
jgi:hypothetical protein